jgi:hypothetical protein
MLLEEFCIYLIFFLNEFASNIKLFKIDLFVSPCIRKVRMTDEFVACHIYAFIWSFSHIMIFLGIYLVFTRQWYLLIVYTVFLSMANQVCLPKIPFVQRFFIPAFRRLCGGCEIIRNDLAARHKNRPVMYAFHPHAIAANGFGLGLHDCVQRGESVTVAVSSWLCWFNPLFRWFVNSMGLRITSVSKTDLFKAMSRRENVALLPGGFEEVLLMQQRRDVVFVRKRFGFLKSAMKYGYDVVPVFIFGESKLYSNLIPLPTWARRLSAKLRIPLVIPKGSTLQNCLPVEIEHGLRIVFGEPLPASETADLMSFHRMYVSRLQVIHDSYNPYRDTPLLLL